ncbi:MAG: hypothetical protein ACLGJC_10145 [Alphaproteobacteria bacterium]
MAAKASAAASAALSRNCVTCPGTACFAGVPRGAREDLIPLGRKLRCFGDGQQMPKLLDGRRYWRIPVMDGGLPRSRLPTEVERPRVRRARRVAGLLLKTPDPEFFRMHHRGDAGLPHRMMLPFIQVDDLRKKHPRLDQCRAPSGIISALFDVTGPHPA